MQQLLVENLDWWGYEEQPEGFLLDRARSMNPLHCQNVHVGGSRGSSILTVQFSNSSVITRLLRNVHFVNLKRNYLDLYLFPHFKDSFFLHTST